MHTVEFAPGRYPLTTYQKDIWLEQCLYPEKPIYNLGGYMDIKGKIDKATLNQALQILIEENDSLRMKVVEDSGEPCLKIAAPPAYALPFYDFSQREQPVKACLDWLQQEFLQPFDWQEYLFQFVLLKASDNRYFWFMRFHHIIIDGFGLSLMYKQVIENYNQLLSGCQAVERLVYSYTDFIADHQKYLASPVFLSDKTFWQDKYRTIPEPLFNRQVSSGAGGSAPSDRLTFSIPRPLYNKMIAFSEKNGGTVFHFILAVLFIYFSRVCNKEEVVLGVPSLNRSKAKYKQTIGLFTNIIPLRINPGKTVSFRELLLLIKSELMECYRHQKFPFGEICRTVFAPGQDKTNLFDVSLSFVNRDFNENYTTASDYDIVSMAHRHERNALTIFVRDYNETRDVLVDFDYRLDVFEKFIPIENVAAHFKHLLGAVLENGEDGIDAITLIPAAEQQLILDDFNATQAEYPANKTIQELFEAQAARHPDKPAVVFDGQWLTFRQLNCKANQLAGVLRQKGVESDSIVGIMTERSPVMVVGMLAVLKAGGAYLPMDPHYPPERIEYMLQDCGAQILLTQTKWQDGIAYAGDILNLEDGKLYSGDGQNPPNRNTAGDLAYVIYTSGSTGNPKGVMVEHRGIANLKTFFQMTYQLNEQDKMLQFASSSFDASVWEIFISLLNGAALVLVSPETIHNFVEFERFIGQNGITIALLPPTYLAGLEPARLTGLKRLITGGSAITKELVAKWRDKVAYSNAYGPTEATVIATTWQYNAREPGYGSVPIGVPILNTQVYILDRHNRPQPVGAAGELCIAGAGLARGYLNRPELTAEKFVANPFHQGERMYKTGDLARWLPDGNIEFLGRIDQQVKIRGFRIELGEIEARLLQHPAVREAAVTVREDKQGDKYLAAYFMAEDSLAAGELREYLLQALPEYMVPSYWQQLDEMPLTPNDKIDRGALPEPDLSRKTAVEYVAPRNPQEVILAEIWQDVLNAERVGIRDNFFNLGGDSIKAIQVLSRLNSYQLKLEMKDLFKHPVIEEVSGLLKNAAHTAEQGSIEGEAALTPIQHWLLEQSFTAKHHFNQAVMLYGQAGFEEPLLRQVMAKLVEHHDALRMVVRQGGEGAVLYNRGIEGKLYSLEVFDWRENGNFREIITREINRIQESLDVYEGPLVKSALFKTPAGDHLLIVIHHLVVDGISWRIILEDLGTGYEQASRQEAVEFAAKTDSFRDWSARLAAYANSPDLLKEAAYWAGLETVPLKPLPKDRIVTSKTYRDAGTAEVEFTAEDTARLLQEVNRAYNTEINDILLTALGLAVKKWSGNSKIALNLEGHGRDEVIGDVDITRTVGWFTAQYPVILDLSGDRDLAGRVKTVKETLRRIPHKGIGYGILKYLTLPVNKENLAFSLRPEISFNYLGQFDAEANNELFGLSSISVGNCLAPAMECPYALDINGMVAGGRLAVKFSYHQGEYNQTTIEKFAGTFRRELLNLINHCCAADAVEMTPSDFTYSNLTLGELETVWQTVDKNNVKDLYALSPMQTGMLYHAIREPGSAAYFEQALLSMDEGLDVNHLEVCFNKLIERYDVLRTAFVYEKLSRPVQVVLRQQKACIQVEDIAHLPPADRDLFIADFKARDKKTGFDLTRGMPLRLAIIRTGNGSGKLLWSFHHIVMDGWCLGIILKEFFSMYACLQTQQKPPGSGRVYPYSDYIQWLGRQDEAAALTYWQAYLSNYEERTLLPKNSAGAAMGKYEPAEFLFPLNETVKDGLEEVARRNQVTFGTLFQTIWGLVLQRYSNTEDVVFGAVVSGRPQEIPGIENMVGLFINTLPVRVQCDGNQSFAALLQQVQQAALESERYSYYPLAEIQTATRLKDTLFDHIIAWENYPMKEAVFGNSGVAVKVEEVFEQTNYDLNLVILPGRQFKIKFMYNTLVYDRQFIERLLENILSVMAAVLRNPAIPVKAVDMVAAAERRERLFTFNQTQVAYPGEATIPELFEAQVRRTPDNLAVVAGGQQFTYRILNEKANQLAGVLRNKGVKPNCLVGVVAERSPGMLLGILAILKAGGAYLPIDPDYPPERIRYMLTDSGAKIVLTQDRLAAKITFGGEVLVLENPALYRGDTADLVRETTARDLAYVIYTSGSTGNPKGVEIEQTSLVNLAAWHRRAYDITAGDRATLIAGPAFDASVWEIWPYLTAGAGLYIPGPETRASLPGLIAWLKDNLITVSFLPTPLAEALLTEEWPPAMALRYMLTGGDQLHRRPRPGLPFTLMNHYGPTENTVVTTCGCVAAGEAADALPSIGRPIDNTEVYILDRHNRLQPAGAPGELCIAGAGLARGYLNRPELTAEKFAANPFRPGTRLYKTGDLARWLADGTIEFLGRIDHQVKIRGFRIELGEIENRLLQYAAVKEACVIDREDGRGDKYLAAYVTGDRELAVDELKAYLLEALPEYMVPLYFTQLDKLPLNPNGKVDRKALPQPEEDLSAGVGYIAPRHEMDARIQAVWQEVLGREKIGIDDNFFSLGGNSIKAIQVAARLALDFEVGINDIFQCQTIRALADKAGYSRDRLKAIVDAMQEAAATRTAEVHFDGALRHELKCCNQVKKSYPKAGFAVTAAYKNILLAGGTGYLGIHILYQLLQNTGYKVYLPVRGKNDTAAKERLWAKLKFHFNLEGDGLADRICVFNGDLSKEYLGLEPDRYRELAGAIDCVINSAAHVKHYGHYDDFHAVNVLGTQRLAEFAGQGKRKAYNFISTTSVGSGYVGGRSRLVFTEEDCDVGQSSDNYYVATKLAAEKFLLKAREKGLPVNIFRVGNLVFDSATGIFQENITDNAFYTLLKCLLKIGYFPAVNTKDMNFSFADSVAKAVVLLFDKQDLQNETYHLFNSRQISMVSLAELFNRAEMPVATMPVNAFVKYLYEKYQEKEMQNYISRILVHSNLFFEGASKTAFILRQQKTERILKTLNFKWPELDEAKIRQMLEHCRNVGFI
ncbi:phosphopantetheine attachment site [Lucifera butyrica]|uniref:Phosphopantetheine attachment site n=1 Tax=Lucifera butyrica TaxID=1351585 RepID=A0A498QY65_9FIRM|nr:non-ribosomal peptide synthetase [Lucifera butyrica]VBB05116.1 phosphopantetheine attachment site [Lucifera butyrica]